MVSEGRPARRCSNGNGCAGAWGRRLVFGGAGEHAAPVAGAAAPFGRLVVFRFGYGRRGELAVPEEVHGQREGVQVACRAYLCFQRGGCS